MSIFNRVSRSGGTTTALLLSSWLAMVDPLMCSLRPCLPIVPTANKRRDDLWHELQTLVLCHGLVGILSSE